MYNINAAAAAPERVRSHAVGTYLYFHEVGVGKYLAISCLLTR
jgi:hypothetical protein